MPKAKSSRPWTSLPRTGGKLKTVTLRLFLEDVEEMRGLGLQEAMPWHVKARLLIHHALIQLRERKASVLK